MSPEHSSSPSTDTTQPDSRLSAVDRLLFWFLIGIVALAPLPLGGNRPLPAALLAFATGLLLAGWAILALIRKRLSFPARHLGIPLLLFGAVAIWVLIQSLPLPSPFADPIWSVASSAIGQPIAGSISVNPGATRTALMHLLTYGAVFWLTLQLTRASDRARTAMIAVVVIGTVYAAYGVAIYLAGNDWILLYRKWAYKNALSATFVNRNSFATFAGLCLLAAVTHFVEGFRYLLTIERPLRQRIALVMNTIFGHGIARTIAMLLLMVALFLTGSRAGIASSLAGLVALMVSFARSGSLRRTHVATLSAAIVGSMVLVFTINGGLFVSRLGDRDTDFSESQRPIVYEATMDAIASTPWTGTGYGTYRDVFAAYRPESLSSLFYWDKAHNDYLENALELGIPAAVALNLCILLLALDALRGLWRRRRNRHFPALAVAATVLVALHSLIDFSLQMPAIAILYAFILGLGVAQSYPQQAAGSPPVYFRDSGGRNAAIPS